MRRFKETLSIEDEANLSVEAIHGIPLINLHQGIRVIHVNPKETLALAHLLTEAVIWLMEDMGPPHGE